MSGVVAYSDQLWLEFVRIAIRGNDSIKIF